MIVTWIWLSGIQNLLYIHLKYFNMEGFFEFMISLSIAIVSIFAATFYWKSNFLLKELEETKKKLTKPEDHLDVSSIL